MRRSGLWRRLLLPIPFDAAAFMARLFEIPTSLFGVKPLLTRDQVDLLRHDNVVSDEAVRAGRTLPGLGIEPTAVEAIIPSYLDRFRKGGWYDRRRAVA